LEKGTPGLDNFQTVRVGPVELLRALTEIALDLNDWNITFYGTSVRWVQLPDLASLEKYLERRVRTALDEPFFDLDWEKASPKLQALETRLAIQDDKLRSSNHFEEKDPPKQFAEARAKLFRLLLCVGNLYGFALSESRSERRPVNLAKSLLYLEKAISLKPELGNSPTDTLVYAYLCLATVNGLLGIRLLHGKEPLIAAEGNSLISTALQYLEASVKQGYTPPHLFHLKPSLLEETDQFGEAAEAWAIAATRWIPVSQKMYFNCGCALSGNKRYADALTQLEVSVRVFDEKSAQLQHRHWSLRSLRLTPGNRLKTPTKVLN
jgi:tetratricopeptide (TPR) repeat protein